MRKFRISSRVAPGLLLAALLVAPTSAQAERCRGMSGWPKDWAERTLEKMPLSRVPLGPADEVVGSRIREIVWGQYSEAIQQCSDAAAQCRSRSSSKAGCRAPYDPCVTEATSRREQDVALVAFLRFCKRHDYSDRHQSCKWGNSKGNWGPKGKTKPPKIYRHLGGRLATDQQKAPRITEENCPSGAEPFSPKRPLHQPFPIQQFFPGFVPTQP
ncbi:MAG: hypothetical protein GY723_03795 [bacterium]|nr:hypothetical protein [bacterium]